MGWSLSVVCICHFVICSEGLLGYSGALGSSWPVYTLGGVCLPFVSVVLYLLSGTGGKEGGADLRLNSNNPTRKGGEPQQISFLRAIPTLKLFDMGWDTEGYLGLSEGDSWDI